MEEEEGGGRLAVDGQLPKGVSEGTGQEDRYKDLSELFCIYCLFCI